MKKIKYWGLVLSLSFLFASCSNSNNDEPSARDEQSQQEKIDESDNKQKEDQCPFVNQILKGKISVSYKRISADAYVMHNNSGNWSYEGELWGLDVPGREGITFHEGKCWTSLVMMTLNGGPNEFYGPLMAYKKKTGYDKEIYVAAPINYNSEAGQILINGDYYQLESIDEDIMKINHVSNTLYANADHEIIGSMQMKWEMEYEKDALLDFSKIESFESEFDCFMAILKMLREEFGEEVDVNKYLHPGSSKEDVVNFDQLEDNLHKKYKR